MCVHNIAPAGSGQPGKDQPPLGSARYHIAQNFGRVNFWQLVARHAIWQGKIWRIQHNWYSQVRTHLMFKNLVGKILAGLDKSTKIFHHQNFALYGIQLSKPGH